MAFFFVAPVINEDSVESCLFLQLMACSFYPVKGEFSGVSVCVGMSWIKEMTSRIFCCSCEI